jgi:hypothetical protein
MPEGHPAPREHSKINSIVMRQVDGGHVQLDGGTELGRTTCSRCTTLNNQLRTCLTVSSIGVHPKLPLQVAISCSTFNFMQRNSRFHAAPRHPHHPFFHRPRSRGRDLLAHRQTFVAQDALCVQLRNVTFSDHNVKPAHFHKEQSDVNALNVLSTTSVAPHRAGVRAPRTYSSYPPTSN